ncbi:MAG: hypothetical protein ACJ8ER_00820 [Allosphingosinicella sp.]
MEPAWKFLIHVIVGAIQFVLILLVAVTLAGIVSMAQTLSFTPHWLVAGIERVEQIVFWADVLAFNLFLIAEVLKLVAGLWWEVRVAWFEPTIPAK